MGGSFIHSFYSLKGLKIGAWTLDGDLNSGLSITKVPSFLLTLSVTSNLFFSSILTSREYSRRNIFLSKEIFYRKQEIEQMKENLVLYTRDCKDSFPWSGSFTSSSLSSAEDSSPYLKNSNSNVKYLFK